MVPLVYWVGAALGVAFFMWRNGMGTKRAIAYVNGAPQEIEISPIGGGHYLRTDAAHAWIAMLNKAALEGIFPEPSGQFPAFRTPEQQAKLVTSEGAYGAGGTAAKVGRSPHQAGIAIDIKNVNPWATGYLANVRAWLLREGPYFGWHNTGAQFSTPEPWHFEWRPS